MLESCLLSGLTRKITLPVKNSHGPPPTHSSFIYFNLLSIHWDFVWCPFFLRIHLSCILFIYVKACWAHVFKFDNTLYIYIYYCVALKISEVSINVEMFFCTDVDSYQLQTDLFFKQFDKEEPDFKDNRVYQLWAMAQKTNWSEEERNSFKVWWNFAFLGQLVWWVIFLVIYMMYVL